MSAPTGLTCAAVNSNFVAETGRITAETHRLGLYKDPLNVAVEKAAFPDGMGNVVSNLISQRTIATGSGWAVMPISDGSSNDACAVPVKTVSYAADLKTSQVSVQAIESNWLCLEDVRRNVFAEKQVNDYIRMLQDNINVEWTNKYDNDIFGASTNKIVVAPGLPSSSGAAFPATNPTSPLTMGVLREIHQSLYENNAGDDGNAITDDGAPVFDVYTDRLTCENLIKQSTDLRQDVRWSDRVNDLLGPNGAVLLPKKAYGGLMFHSRPFPKRFNDDGAGGYVEVAPYSTTAATKGTKAVVSAAYKAAKYGSTAVFVPKSLTWLVPGQTKIAGLTFGPQNYTGELKWMYPYDKTCNPDENSGFFRAKMAVGLQQNFPDWIYYILHLRCALDSDLIACGSGAGYGYLR